MVKELIIKETNISGEFIKLLIIYFNTIAWEQILSMTKSVRLFAPAEVLNFFLWALFYYQYSVNKMCLKKAAQSSRHIFENGGMGCLFYPCFIPLTSTNLCGSLSLHFIKLSSFSEVH